MALACSPMSRRRAAIAGAAVLAVLPLAGWSRADERRLRFRHLHTGERLDVVYVRDGRYQPAELLRVDQFMRDWREDEAIRIDHRLLDFLHDVQLQLGAFAEHDILCGYRTPATNAMLRRRSRGVAKRSFHMVGKAIDVTFSGARLSSTRNAAVDLAAGGVGYYPRSSFLHLDTGPVRAWRA